MEMCIRDREHTYLIGIKATTEYFHNLFCQLAATAIYLSLIHI